MILATKPTIILPGRWRSAGDVNGDGYADVIAGEPDEEVGYTDEGRAYIWYGHASGISGNADWYTLGGYANARFWRLGGDGGGSQRRRLL